MLDGIRSNTSVVAMILRKRIVIVIGINRFILIRSIVMPCVMQKFFFMIDQLFDRSSFQITNLKSNLNEGEGMTNSLRQTNSSSNIISVIFSGVLRVES